MKLACSSNPAARSRRAAVGAALIGVGLSLFTGPAALAQQPSKEELNKARTAFQEGVALAAANNCAGALVKYKEVAQVKMTAQVSFNIAECEERLGKLVQALGNYRLAVNTAGEDRNLQKLLREAGSRVEDLEVRIPRLTLTRDLKGGVDAAVIQLDGTEIGQAQLGAPIPVNPGSHVIIAKVEGKEYLHQNVTLVEKEKKTFEIKLDVPKPRIEKPVVEQMIDAPPPPPKSRVPGAVVTAVGGAALVGGIVAIVLRAGATSTLGGLCNDKNQCPDTQEARDAASKGKTFTGLSEVLIPVGVAGAAVGIFLLATSGPQKAKAPSKDTPADKQAARGSKVELVGWVPSAPGASIGGLSMLGRF